MSDQNNQPPQPIPKPNSSEASTIPITPKTNKNINAMIEIMYAFLSPNIV